MKYFVCSDIHSYYTEWMIALKEIGYDKNNPNHCLLVLGDLFDRGSESKEVYKFIRSINNKILIRGNHEYMIEDIAKRAITHPTDNYIFYSCDESNGTVDTLEDMFDYDILASSSCQLFSGYKKIQEDYGTRQRKLLDKYIHSNFYRWLKNKNNWKNYFEIGPYIFVHAFIPLKNLTRTNKLSGNALSMYEISNGRIGNVSSAKYLKYDPNWRNTPNGAIEWEESTWGCPWQLYQDGLFDEEAKQGKTLVCGHWYTGDFYLHLTHGQVDGSNNPIYVGDNLIAMDAHTPLTNRVNIMMLDEDMHCYDVKGNRLK